MKDMDIGSYRDLSALSCDEDGWRAAANQSREIEDQMKKNSTYIIVT